MIAPPHWAGFALTRPLVMGILNVTPDSFSDGAALDPARAVARGLTMLNEGADIIDIGGESTRPGAEPVSPAEEIARIMPIVAELAAAGAVVSADTRNAATMKAALAAGARIINDISGLRHDPAAAALVASSQCPIVLMHMRGTPQTMNDHAHYTDLVGEVRDELKAIRDAACAAGIQPSSIALDPGFGFAKIGRQNVLLLQALATIADLAHPVLVGISRKRFIGDLAGERVPARRDAASIAASLYAARHGAAILRVHDVAGTVQALKVCHALAASDAPSDRLLQRTSPVS